MTGLVNVLSGDAGASADALRPAEGSLGWSPRGEVLWRGANGSRYAMLFIGPPEMTEVRVSEELLIGVDGSLSREARDVRTDDGVFYMDLTDTNPAEVRIRPRVAGEYRPATGPGYSVNAVPADTRAKLLAAAGRAVGSVDENAAWDVLETFARHLDRPERLDVAFAWGGRLDSANEATVAVVSSPGTPSYLTVRHVVRPRPEGPYEVWRLGRILPNPLKTQRPPVAWTYGERNASAAVFVPGGAGARVEVRRPDGRLVASGNARQDEIAVFATGLRQADLKRCEYRVVGADGQVTASGSLDMPGLDDSFTLAETW
jgi:hypothetical protein